MLKVIGVPLKAEAAQARGALFAERRGLIEDWPAHLGSDTAGVVRLQALKLGSAASLVRCARVQPR